MERVMVASNWPEVALKAYDSTCKEAALGRRVCVVQVGEGSRKRGEGLGKVVGGRCWSWWPGAMHARRRQ